MALPNIDAAHLGRLRDHYAQHGTLPSYAGMGDVLGFRAKTAAVKLAQRLTVAGYLRSAPGGKLAPTVRFFEVPRFDSSVRAGVAEAIDAQSAPELVTIEGLLIESPSTTVLIRVKGDSMRDAGIFDGDLAVVDRAAEPSPGAFVVANIDGEFTLKELRFEGNFPVLIPHNADFAAIRPTRSLEVFGVVRGIVRKYKAGGPLGAAKHSKLGGAKA